MRRRHPTLPSRWLFTDERLGEELWPALRRLPRGSGVIVRHHALGRPERRRLLERLRRIGRSRGLLVWDERKAAVARVHSMQELRQALLRAPDLLFLSPLFETRTHPEWLPLPRMRAAALIRLSPRPVFGLGGMNERRFAKLKPLGLAGYGAIDRWLRT
ncbi:thiamine phosphate synthase [Sphingomonas arenae]|uniref:thiamine phosphate synthase n=1 Tax=Sphingomonas arenae TaxID=2812555 RepID=UPI0019684877|nr:thiamine phosphate synthase [Sphingomonas arenae]